MIKIGPYEIDRDTMHAADEHAVLCAYERADERTRRAFEVLACVVVDLEQRVANLEADVDQRDDHLEEVCEENKKLRGAQRAAENPSR